MGSSFRRPKLACAASPAGALAGVKGDSIAKRCPERSEGPLTPAGAQATFHAQASAGLRKGRATPGDRSCRSTGHSEPLAGVRRRPCGATRNGPAFGPIRADGVLYNPPQRMSTPVRTGETRPAPEALVERTDLLRQETSRQIHPERQAEMGQFFTPAPTARLMASMF